MKRTCLTIAMMMLVFLSTRDVQAQSLRMVADVNLTSTANDLTVWSRTVFDNKIYFAGNNGTAAKLYAMDGNGASVFLPQITMTPGASLNHKLHNAGSQLIFWGDDGIKGAEPWRSDGTVNGSYMLANLDKKGGSQLFHSIISIGSLTYFGCFEYFRSNPLSSDLGLYQTDGSTKGTIELFDDMYVHRLVELNGNLIIDGTHNNSVGRELWLYDGNTIAPIGTLSPGNVSGGDDFPYAQWYNRHVYVRHEPVVASNCAFFNTWSDGEGNELWCTNGTALRQITGLSNGSYSTYPVQMIPMDGNLYFVGLDVTHGSELWSFPLSDPMLSGTAAMVQDLTGDATHSEPCWLTVYNGKLYFSAYTETTGRELFRYDGSSITLAVDINPGFESSNPKSDPAEVSPFWYEIWDNPVECLTLTEFNGKLYFAADDGAYGIELWWFDGVSAGLAMDVNTGAEGSDPRFLTVYNGKLYFTAYTPQHGRAWYEYDPGGSSVNQPPVAVAGAAPTTGIAPLSVAFNSTGSYDPDGTIASYAWTFGDSGTGSGQAPSHTYQSAGTYTAVLTVTDNSSATATASVTITATSTGGFVHVESQTVTSVVGGGNKVTGQDVVLIHDAGDNPVAGAVVFATYDGPTSGTVSGTTGSNGTVTLVSSWIRNPSLDWCFTITDVQASGYTFDAATGSPGRTCESVPKRSTTLPAACILEQNYPNPFNPSTFIRFAVPQEEPIRLVVSDILGREVTRLVDGLVTAGRHNVRFDAQDLPAGVYHYRLETSMGIQVRKMSLIK